MQILSNSTTTFDFNSTIASDSTAPLVGTGTGSFFGGETDCLRCGNSFFRVGHSDLCVACSNDIPSSIDLMYLIGRLVLALKGVEDEDSVVREADEALRSWGVGSIMKDLGRKCA